MLLSFNSTHHGVLMTTRHMLVSVHSKLVCCFLNLCLLWRGIHNPMPLESVYITFCDVVYTYAYYGVVFTIRCLWYQSISHSLMWLPLVSVYITLCDVVYTYAYYAVVFTIRCLWYQSISHSLMWLPLVSVYITLCDVVYTYAYYGVVCTIRCLWYQSISHSVMWFTPMLIMVWYSLSDAYWYQSISHSVMWFF